MTHVFDLLDIKYPIIQGGMGNISNAKLTSAVSEAGGLGTIGCGTMTASEVEEIILATKILTDKPFAVNIALSVSPHPDKLVQLVVKHNIPIVSLSAGNPSPYIPILREKGIKVIVLVASVKHALKAEDAGADVLVAEGFEAAGINSDLELTTFTLIPQIVQHVSIPVLAAGGVGNGKGLAAAFVLGASGVQLGTRFIATKEAPFHDSYKNRLVKAEGTETIIVGRTVGQVRRILKTPYAERILNQEKEGITPDEYRVLTSEVLHAKGALEGDLKNGFLNSGQVTGLINNIPTVKELLDEMMEEAKKQINQTARLFDGYIH
ncbi:nitronate monooxygenase [Virgibacillus sp. C22-A2]|uniref:Probable nitronate monooxygenase n=1 Tax=Virgibacillus tibetensis TaxID=3042313 RepID=A0ABU6KI42_9BACI|nr:nitronate monooxygenase [Virgibacillus sp. C22-A2]